MNYKVILESILLVLAGILIALFIVMFFATDDCAVLTIRCGTGNVSSDRNDWIMPNILNYCKETLNESGYFKLEWRVPETGDIDSQLFWYDKDLSQVTPCSIL